MSKYRHTGVKYQGWRKKVLKKGEYRCCLCGAMENLTCDHIIPISRDPTLEFDPDNGRVLCEPCRKKELLRDLANGKLRTSKQTQKKIKKRKRLTFVYRRIC